MTQPSAIQRADAAACASPITAAENDTGAVPPGAAKEGRKRERELFLEPWRCARSGAALAFLALIIASLDDHLLKDGKRGIKSSYRVKWEKAVDAVTSSLALAILYPPPTGRLVMPRQKERSGVAYRYRTPLGDGRMVARLQDRLEAAGLILVNPPEGRGLATTVTPSDLFTDLVRLAGLTGDDFGLLAGQELVILGETTGVGKARRREDRDYLDTGRTTAMRADVERFNARLASAALSYVGARRVDTGRRTLRRCFTVRAGEPTQFDQGGRFFGGFWQSGIKKDDRHNIRINGERIVELDYSAAFTHIAFASMDLETPAAGDLYAIPGLEALGRRQVKHAVNTLYFDNHRRRAWPEDFREIEWSDPESGEVFEGFPAKFTPKLVRAAIVNRYPSLDAAMSKGLGLRFMFLESEMLRRLLLALDSLNITALPLHDAVAVARSDGQTVASLMREAAIEVIGRPIPVTQSEPDL